jgi:hypothetical protein
MLALALSTVGCVVLCYTLGRYNRAVTLQRWQFVLNAPGRQAVDTLRAQMDLDSALAQQAVDAANRTRAAGRAPDAVTVLRVALSVLEDAGADRLTRLKAMGVYSRMVRALQPLPAPTAAAFKNVQVRTVAASAGLLHRVLVGAEERFRLWLLMLGLGVRIVLRGGRRSADAVTRHPHAPRPWDEFADGVSDFRSLDKAHLAAFEALAASLAAIDRGGRVRLWDQIANG